MGRGQCSLAAGGLWECLLARMRASMGLHCSIFWMLLHQRCVAWCQQADADVSGCLVVLCIGVVEAAFLRIGEGVAMLGRLTVRDGRMGLQPGRSRLGLCGQSGCCCHDVFIAAVLGPLKTCGPVWCRQCL